MVRTNHYLIVLFIWFASLPDLGLANFELSVARALDSHVLKALRSYMPGNSFQLRSDITLKQSSEPDIPYLPSSPSKLAIKNMALREIIGLTQTITINIWVDTDFETEELESYLLDYLGLAELNRGDSVNIKPYTPGKRKSAEESDEKTQELDRLQNRLSTSQNESGSLRNRINILENEIDKVSREKLFLQAQMEEAKNGGPSFAETLWTKLEGEYGQYTIGAFVLICLIAFLIAWLLTRSVKSIGDGLKSVSGAIGSSFSSNDSSSTVSESASLASGGVAAPDSDSASGDKASSFNPVELSERIATLKEETAKQLELIDRNWLFIQVGPYLKEGSSEKDAMTGVAILEFLGKDMAAALWEEMQPYEQSKVRAILESKEYAKSKLPLMVAGIEQLKTKMVAKEFAKGPEDLNPELQSQVLRLDQDSVNDLIGKMDPEVLPRMMIFLKPRVLSSAIDTISANLPNKFDTVMKAVAKLPKAKEDDSQDSKLKDLIRDQLMLKENPHLGHLQYYTDTLNNIKVANRDKAIKSLQSIDSTMHSLLLRRVHTVQTFFYLTPSAQEEVCGKLQAIEAALLTLGMEETDRNYFIQMFRPKVQELIQDELASMSDGVPPELQTASEEAAERMVQIIGGIARQRPQNEVFRLEGEKPEPKIEAHPGGGEAA